MVRGGPPVQGSLVTGYTITCTLLPAWWETVPAAFTTLGPYELSSQVLQQRELEQVCSRVFFMP